MWRTGDLQGRQSIVTPDTIFLVHHKIALGDLGRFALAQRQHVAK